MNLITCFLVVVFKLLDRIYQSNSSIICMGEDRFCGHAVAIKIVTDRVKAVGELKMLKRMGHPNIVSVTDCFEDNHCVAIVMELMSMDLKVFMHTVAYSFSTMKEIMLQSMRGLHHMHTRDFIHMDLKPYILAINPTHPTEISVSFAHNAVSLQGALRYVARRPPFCVN